MNFMYTIQLCLLHSHSFDTSTPKWSNVILFFSPFIIFIGAVTLTVALIGLGYLLNLIWKELKKKIAKLGAIASGMCVSLYFCLLRAFLSNMSKNITFSISKPNFITYNAPLYNTTYIKISIFFTISFK